LIDAGTPHTLSLRPFYVRHLPFGGRLESLDIIAVTQGDVGFSHFPVTNAVTDFSPYQAGNQTITLSLDDLSVHFSVFMDFSDVPPGHSYYAHIRFAAENGLFNGVSPSDFAPEAPMTRAMFVTVLGRQAERMGKEISGDHSQFTDVEDGRWFTPYIGWAAERGIAQGFGDVFILDAPVTREQMATFLLRFMRYADLDLTVDETPTYRDRDTVSPWSLGAVDVMVALDLIALRDNGHFRPGEYATRAEVARALSVLAQEQVNN